MAKLFDRVKFNVSGTPGTGTCTVGTRAASNFYLPSEVGASNQEVYYLLINSSNDEEHGIGTVNSGGTTVSRDRVIASIIGGVAGTTKIAVGTSSVMGFTTPSEAVMNMSGEREVTVASDAIVNLDGNSVIIGNRATAIALSLAAPTGNSMTKGWFTYIKNIGVGSTTITPTTVTINGDATLVLPTNMGVFIWSDGTNYHAYFFPVTKPLLAANNLSDLAAKHTALDNLSIHGADIAAAGTLNLEAATGNLIDVTGTTTITAITLSEGHERTVRFATGTAQINHGASLILPGSANITTVAGDIMVFRGYAAGVVRCVMYSPITVTGTGAEVRANSPTLTTAALGSSTATTQSANDNSTKVATTAYADNVRDAPRVLSLSNGSASANLADIDVITLPSGNSSTSTITSVSNGVVGKVYVFYNTGGSDGLRSLNFSRSQWYLPNSTDISLGFYDTFLAYCNSTTTIVGAAPHANNG